MVSLRFSEDMRATLSSMKGKTLKSYMGAPLSVDGYVIFVGSVRINLGRSAIDITNLFCEADVFGDKDELSCFQCKAVDKNSAFDQCLSGPVMEFMINERVKSVELVTDHVTVSNYDYEIESDMAIIIRTNKTIYTFTRDWCYSEDITVNISHDEPVVYELEKVRENWEDSGDNTVEVKRRIEEL